MLTRMVGSTMLWIGAAVGAAGAIALLPLSGLHGLAWVAGVGLVKLSLASAAGLMAGGAVLRRVALRSAARQRALDLGAGPDIGADARPDEGDRPGAT
jgi:hypothetical protein